MINSMKGLSSLKVAGKLVRGLNCKKTERINSRLVYSKTSSSNKESVCQETDSVVDKRYDISKLLDEAALSNNPNPESPEDVWATSPYPEGAVLKRDQSKFIRKPKIDPRETSIILFPGQGTQFVGMGKDLMRFPIASDLFDAANDLLGYDLKKLCLNGPKSQLDKTIHCQPAVVVCSLASIERLREERPAAIDSCVATAGFSVGEITALVFAGALSFEDEYIFIVVRAEAMQLASEIIPSGMMTVFYGPDSKLNFACLRAREWCLERGIEDPECCVANYMYPHCKVIAGHMEALKYIESNAQLYKLKRLKRIPVSGAFHSSLMKPAVEPVKEVLKKIDFSDPIIQVLSNVDGKPYRDAFHIKGQLPKQMYKPVRWEQILHALYERTVGEHFPRTFECGPGTSLKSILKMVNGKAWNSCFSYQA
ncbi:hypothetical protein L9F63_016082 [Diploptera punctata]|uniref:[acyl-carrier-protein] S-malonyltransferase n=1 Tax=Diploptera punctata TaxID=6984 RepID=A0AAD8EIK4_DIPPU|nr:hypothetical protein L9F63_016082 [Diploptera punctata]